MAKASTYGDATAASPQTRCTTCRTVFEVSPELLSSSDTRVRCGECLSIFDALANLRSGDEDDVAADAAVGAGASGTASADGDEADDETPDTLLLHDLDGASPPPSGLDDETGALDVTYSDFDLFSGDAQLPEIAYLDATADTPDFDFDSVDVGEDETFSDTLFADDATIEPVSLGAGADGAGPATARIPPSERSDPDFVDDDDDTVEPPVFRYRDREEEAEEDDTIVAVLPRAPVDDGAAASPPSGTGIASGTSAPVPSGGGWGLRLLMALSLAVLLGGLYVYRERGALHNDPFVRPVLVAGCRVIGCTVPSRVDLASLRLLDKKVYTHPSEADALVINIAFRNTATFDQRYPVLVVRLRDRVGRRVAERDFEPSDYLDEWRTGDTLEAGRRLDISLEVGDPGDGADSYEFEFREAAG